MNLKNFTIALIIALAYEIFLKLIHFLIPSIFDISSVHIITRLLLFVVGVVIIFFICLFYKEEKDNREIKTILQLLIGCIIIQFLFRLPITKGLFGIQIVRYVVDIMDFVKAIFLFILVIFYKKKIPSSHKSMSQATIFLIVIFGVEIIKSLYALIVYTSYLISGITIDYSHTHYHVIFFLFILTHASIIYFLYNYYHLRK